MKAAASKMAGQRNEWLAAQASSFVGSRKESSLAVMIIVLKAWRWSQEGTSSSRGKDSAALTLRSIELSHYTSESG